MFDPNARASLPSTSGTLSNLQELNKQREIALKKAKKAKEAYLKAEQELKQIEIAYWTLHEKVMANIKI